MNKLKQFWSYSRGSFRWFVPSLIIAVSSAFDVALIETDSTGSDRLLASCQRLFVTGAKDAHHGPMPKASFHTQGMDSLTNVT